MKEKNENPRPLGDPATKVMKKKLWDMVEDSSVLRLPQAKRASVHIRQLLEVAIARTHKPRAFTFFFDRVPPLTAKIALEAADGLEARIYQCLPPISGNDIPAAPCI